MITTVPEIDSEVVRQTLHELATQGVSVPEPQSVDVEAGEDHEGDPTYFLTVTFGKHHRPDQIPWLRISPLVRALSRRVFLAGGGHYQVISKVRRLGEKQPTE